MDIAVYDTGRNYLVAELRKGNPLRGILIDKGFGSLAEDSKLFESGGCRFGATKLGLMDSARIASRSRFVAKFSDGELVECMEALYEDEGLMRYAGVQPEE